jgi:hypothetical protein
LKLALEALLLPRLCSFKTVFPSHRPNELNEGGAGGDAIELGAVVTDYADVLDHQIVDFNRERRTSFGGAQPQDPAYFVFGELN